MSAKDLDEARYWLGQADGSSPEWRQAYASIANVWAYIAWVDHQRGAE